MLQMYCHLKNIWTVRIQHQYLRMQEEQRTSSPTPLHNTWAHTHTYIGLFYPPRGRLRVLHVTRDKDGDYDVSVGLQILDILGGREEAPPTSPSLVEEVASDGAYVHEALYNGK